MDLPNPVIPPTAKIVVAPVAEAKAAENPEVKAAEVAAKAEAAPVAKTEAKSTMESRVEASLAEKTKKPETTEPVAKVEGDDATLNAEIEASTKGMGAKERAAFTKLRYENRDLARKAKEAETAAARLAELEKKVTEAKAAPETDSLRSELEAAKKRIEEQETELTVGRLEATQEFKNAVAAPKKAVAESVAKIAEKYKLDAGRLLAVLADADDDGEKLAEVIADAEKPLPQGTQFELFAARKSLAEIASKESVLRANAAETLKRIGERSSAETEQQKSERLAARAEASVASWKELTGAVPVLSAADGDDEVTKAWNEGLASAERFAETDFGALAANTQVAIMQRAGAFPLLAGAVSALQQQLDAANVELSKLRSAQPSAAPRRGGDSRAADTKNTTFEQRVEASLAAAGVS